MLPGEIAEPGAGLALLTKPAAVAAGAGPTIGSAAMLEPEPGGVHVKVSSSPTF